MRIDSLPKGARVIQTQASEEKGTACASATNAAECTSALVALRFHRIPKACASWEWGGNCRDSYLAYTRGDQVGIIRTRDEALAFFGTIDTPEEAYWLSRFEAKLYPQCDASPLAASRVTADAIDIVLKEGGCLTDEFEVLLRVHRDGQTEMVDRKALGTKGSCP